MLEDQEIIERCQHGQTELVDLLIDRYRVPLYTQCCKLARTRADADDLFQDTWIAALKNLGSFMPERRVWPWLVTICINRYRDRYRKGRRWRRRIKTFFSGEEQDRELDQARSAGPDPETELASKERRDQVRQVLETLDDGLRLPVLLHYSEGLTMDEIGAALGIPAGTVKSRLSTARRRIRERLEVLGHA